MGHVLQSILGDSRRRAVAIVTVAILLAALLPFASSLRPGWMAFGTDTLAHDVPVNLYGWRRTALSGTVPLWSDHLRGGLPMVGLFAFMPYYPPNWLMGLAVWLPDFRELAAMGSSPFMSAPSERAVRSYAWAHTLQWPLHHALGALLMFLFLRRLGRSDGAALLGGIIFGLAPHVVTLTYAGHLAKVQAIAWMPGALWALTPCRRGGGPGAREAALAGVCLAMPFLAGHPQIAAYSWALAGGWCLAWSLNARSRGLAGWQQPLAALLPAMALGFALAAPQLLPGLEMLPHSNRAALPMEEITKSSYPPEELLELVVPLHRGESIRPELGGQGDYRGRWGERIVSDYLGTLAVVLALVGLLLGSGRARWWWLFVFVTAMVLCLGGYLGRVYELVIAFVPGMGLFRSPATGMVLLPFALAPLAASGVDRLGRQFPTRQVPIVAGIAIVCYLQATRVNMAFVRPLAADRAIVPSLAADALPPGEPALPRGRFVRGRELVLWPMLHGWSVPLGYHPIYLARQDAAARRLGFDSIEFAMLSRSLAIEEGGGKFSIVKHPYEGPVGIRGEAFVIKEDGYDLGTWEGGRYFRANGEHWKDGEKGPAVPFDIGLGATVTRFEAATLSGLLRFSVSLSRENRQAILVPRPWTPGWQATATDAATGRRQWCELLPVNFIHTLAIIPDGKEGSLHEVELNYLPGSTRWGWLLAALGAAAVAGLVGFGSQAPRRDDPLDSSPPPGNG